MKPVSEFDNLIQRKQKILKIRPMPESKLKKFENWLKVYQWDELFKLKSSHEKAEHFQEILMEKFNQFLPERQVKFCNEDQPYFTPELKTLDRKRKKLIQEK